MFSLILLCLFAVFIKSLHLLYLFQIKEYRFDRFNSYLKERGTWLTLYSLHIKYPKISVRNILIVFFIVSTLCISLLLALEVSFLYYFFTGALLIAPFLSLGLVATGVITTQIPVSLYRRRIIQKAKIKLCDSRTQFVGITGSFGKTSVKEFIYKLLASQYETEKTNKNMNTDIGVALSILHNLKKDTHYFITEFGAYKKGEIKNASSYIPLSYAVLTGIGNQHLDLYGSKRNLIDEETYLLYKVPKKGKVYINYDIPVRKEISRDIEAERIYYGTHPNADIQATLISSDNKGQKARITYKSHTFEIHTKLIGEHSIINLLPAIALSIDLGIPIKKIVSTIFRLKPIYGKLSLHKGVHNSTILNDAANSNVEGFIAGLKTLNKFPQQSKIIISQGIIELGVEKRTSYERIIKELNKTLIQLITTDNLFSEINGGENIATFNDVKSLVNKLKEDMSPTTVVLIEGKFPQPILDSIITK